MVGQQGRHLRHGFSATILGKNGCVTSPVDLHDLPKHVTIMELLRQLQAGEVFTSKAIDKALGRISWATSVCPLSRPFLEPFWAWKMACKTSGKPAKLVTFFAKLLQMIFSVPYKQPSPYVGVSNWWGASDASATRDVHMSRPWIGGWISDMEAPDKSAVWWFQLEIQPDECPWAFVDGDSIPEESHPGKCLTPWF